MKSYKSFLLSESDTSDATNTEMAICLAHNMKTIQSKKGTHVDMEKLFAEAQEMAGIAPAKWNKVSNQKELLKIGTAVANDPQLGNVGKWLIHSGTGKATTHYKKGSDVTPKTDLFGNARNRFSLKKAGDSGTGAQLMSAKSGEASGVMRGAIAHLQANQPDVIVKGTRKTFDILEKKMLATSRNMNVEVRDSKNDFAKWYHDVRLPELEKLAKKLKTRERLYPKNKPSAFTNKLKAHIKDELSALGVAATKTKGNNLIDGLMIARPDFDKMMQKYIKSNVALGDVKVSPKHLKNISPKELTKSKLRTEIVDILKISMDSQEWKVDLANFLTTNASLKKWLVYEAASGLYKFTGKASTGKKYTGDETAVANTMLVFYEGGIKTKENTFNWSMSNASLADNLDVSFKGSGRSKYIKLGIAASYEPMGSTLMEETVDRIFEEEYQKVILTEGRFSDMVSDIKGKVASAARMLWENIIKRIIQKMKEWAEKGLTYLLDVMGIEIEGSVAFKTPSW